jgi:hypothetical protein
MPKDDKLVFEGIFAPKDLETHAREFGENRKLEIAAAYAHTEDANLAAAQQVAYDAAVDELIALPASEVRWPVQDPRLLLEQALNQAEEVAGRLSELETAVAGKLRIDLMLALERYALAAMHAFKLHRDNPAPAGSLPMLVHEAALRRHRLGLACDLAFRGELPAEGLLPKVEGNIVPETIAYDIFRLRRTLLESDPKTGGPWYANHDELAHAEQLANTLLGAAANPALRTALAWAPADIYARAYTLVHRACYEAELGLVELDNATRPADEQHAPLCIFCDHEGATLLSIHKN